MNCRVTVQKNTFMDLEISKPGELRFIEKSSVFENVSTAVRWANKKTRVHSTLVLTQ